MIGIKLWEAEQSVKAECVLQLGCCYGLSLSHCLAGSHPMVHQPMCSVVNKNPMWNSNVPFPWIRWVIIVSAFQIEGCI